VLIDAHAPRRSIINGDAESQDVRNTSRHDSQRGIYVVSRLGSLTDSGEVVYISSCTERLPLPRFGCPRGTPCLFHETRPARQYLFCRADSLGDLTAKMQPGKLPALRRAVSLNREMLMEPTSSTGLVRERMSSMSGAGTAS